MIVGPIVHQTFRLYKILQRIVANKQCNQGSTSVADVKFSRLNYQHQQLNLNINSNVDIRFPVNASTRSGPEGRNMLCREKKNKKH